MLTYYFADDNRIKDLYWNLWMPCLLGEKSQLVEVLGVPCLIGTAVFYNDSDVEEFVQQHPTTSRAKEVTIILNSKVHILISTCIN